MPTYTLLVIDDDPNIRKLLEDLLSGRPEYRLLVAGGGREALKLLTEERIDVVLTDIYMPGFTGLELVGDLQKINVRPEILVMTANATPENIETARKIGARSVILKPFDDLSVVEGEIEKALAALRAAAEAGKGSAYPPPPRRDAAGPVAVPGPAPSRPSPEAPPPASAPPKGPTIRSAPVMEVRPSAAPPELPDFDAWKVEAAPAETKAPPSRAAAPASKSAAPVRDMLLLPDSPDDPADQGPEATAPPPGPALSLEPAPAPAPKAAPPRKVAPSPEAAPLEEEALSPEQPLSLEPPLSPEPSLPLEPAHSPAAAASRPHPSGHAAPAERTDRPAPGISAEKAPAERSEPLPPDLEAILAMGEALDLGKMRIQVPIVCLQTYEEERAIEALRGVAAARGREFYTWTAARGIVKEQDTSMGDVYQDPRRALEFIRRQKHKGLYVLTDFRRHLEEPALARLLREMVMGMETARATVVLTGPQLLAPPELASACALFDWPSSGAASLHGLFEEVLREIESSAGSPLDLGPEEVLALLGRVKDLPSGRARFEIARALMASVEERRRTA